MSVDISITLTMRPWTSRIGAAGAALLTRLGAAGWAEEEEAEDKAWLVGGFRLGLQSYSLRHFSYDQALAQVQELGLHYLEVYPGHLPPTEDRDRLVATRRQLEEHQIQLLAYGVCGFGADEAPNRALFEFAQAVGIRSLSADPAPDSFESLDRLVEEFGINIAIHNHGPGHRYATEGDLLKAVEGHHELIGLCLDTGHLARAGGDSVRLIRTLKSRVYGVHLKDVNADQHDVPLGTGVLPIRDILQALRDGKFKGCLALEYELQPEAPLEGIRQSLDFIRQTIGQLAPAEEGTAEA